ncbi:hypothetical protein E3T25_11360 [Cryobacterium sandaracinum]|uniref:DGQHR domain-containing protein n=1 Tax=Cryobacterium sandaracinum TaxID=1259247 RepID=A0ABY2JAM7_9MICO|nr:DNA sulfur modification protein DndB [Cryobacterium sandaracinum]TFD01398.1 hypothetical protein E3T25_11360 [Cryobacterium sandaracinum]
MSDANYPIVRGPQGDFEYLCARYQQGGRVVYGLTLSLIEIVDLLPAPDADRPTPGNRAIRPDHAAKFGEYVRERESWVAPSIILRAPSIFSFELQGEMGGAEFGALRFSSRNAGELQILDGQHRVLGIHLADAAIAAETSTARGILNRAHRVDPDGAAALNARKDLAELATQRDRLLSERVSVQIFEEKDPAAYKQMFFDIADNALGITESVKTRFDSRKVVNRSFESVVSHPLLQGRVDFEKDRVTSRNSPYLLGAKHVAELIKTIAVGLDGRISLRREAELNESTLAADCRAFLDVLIEGFPVLGLVANGNLSPQQLRSSSLLGSTVVLRILGGVYRELLVAHGYTGQLVSSYFWRLAPFFDGPVERGSIWMKRTDVFAEGAFAPRSRRQDQAALRDALVAWAIDRPDWLFCSDSDTDSTAQTLESSTPSRP